MDTTKRIKTFTAVYLLITVIYLALSFWLESSLPPTIQEYLAAEFERESTQFEDAILIIAITAFIFHIVAIFSIFKEKASARKQFIYSYFAFFLMGPFFGVYIDHGVSATIGSAATVVAGIIVALFLFTESAFNKSRHRTASPPAA